MPVNLDLFYQNPVFKVLPQKRLELLVAEGVIRKYEKGQCITNAGDLWPYFFLLASGSIHALKYSLEGRSLVVTTFLPGDIFWGLAFFYEHMPMPVTLEATKTTKIYLWSIEQMHPIFNGKWTVFLGAFAFDDRKNGACQ